jgi:putative RecB family exonuclease
MNLPRDYISYNQIHLYQSCPQKYYFSYIEEIKTPINEKVFLGILFHSVLEYYFNKKIKNQNVDEEMVKSDFLVKYETFQNDKEIIWQSSKEKVSQRGISFIHYFLHKMAPGIDPLMVERELEVELSEPGIKLKGIIDLVETDFSITDFKTTTSKWSNDRLNRSFLQMVIYKYLFEQSFGKVNSKLKLKILYSKSSNSVNHQEIDLKSKDVDMVEMFKIIKYVAENISKGIFYKNESYLCGFCDFKDICKNYR